MIKYVKKLNKIVTVENHINNKFKFNSTKGSMLVDKFDTLIIDIPNDNLIIKGKILGINDHTNTLILDSMEVAIDSLEGNVYLVK